jgi:hypothetical protein
MKVFISWSGERSKAVAEALRYWLPKVIQAIQPWMSANDIDKGTRWRSGIAQELEQSRIGVICLTPENLKSEWIHFEAGALSKQQENTYVCTFLYGLEPADLREPLAQFQTTRATQDEVRQLIHTINRSRSENRLPDSEINETLDVWWSKLEERLNAIPKSPDAVSPQRKEREILEEILGIVRSIPLSSRLSYPEQDDLIDLGNLPRIEQRYLSNVLRIPMEKLSGIKISYDALLPFFGMVRDAQGGLNYLPIPKTEPARKGGGNKKIKEETELDEDSHM